MSTNHLYYFQNDSQATTRYRWRQITVPTSYIQSNLPLRYTTKTPISPFNEKEGIKIAVAGRRGFAIYHCKSKSWKIIGNMHLEQRIHIDGGMAFWSPTILVTIERLNGAEQSPIPTITSTANSEQVIRFWCTERRKSLKEDSIIGTINIEQKWKVVGMSFVQNATNSYDSNGTTTAENSSSGGSSSEKETVHLLVLVLGIPLPTRGYWLHKMLVYRVIHQIKGGSDSSGSTSKIITQLKHTVKMPRSASIKKTFVLEKFHDRKNHSEEGEDTNRKASSTKEGRRSSSSWSLTRFHYIFVYHTSDGLVRTIPIVIENNNSTDGGQQLYVPDRTTTIPQFVTRPVDEIWSYTNTNDRTVPKYLRSSCWVHGVEYGIQLW
jgi:hypothetical protein